MAEPGRSSWTGKLPSGPAGVAMIWRPYLRPVASIAWPSSVETPLMVSGPMRSFVPSRRMRRTAAAARGEAALAAPASRASGGSVGLARIDSIGVASPTLPPYAPTDCEMAPMLRLTPAPSGQ